VTEEPILETSLLSQEISSGGYSVKIEIYRLTDEKLWTLEVVDEFGNSTVWDDGFITDSAALTEAKKAILEEKITHFIGPKDGKGDGERWR
jgi:uncharacterized protein